MAPLEAEFIALEMPANFLEALEADIVAFEAALSDKHTTRHAKSAATASMESVVDRGVSIVYELQAVVHNRFRTDDGLREAWRRASRIERPHRASRARIIPVAPDSEGKTAAT